MTSPPLSTATLNNPGTINTLDQLSQFVGQNGHKPLWVAPQLHDQLLAHYGADNTVVAHPMGEQSQQMSSDPSGAGLAPSHLGNIPYDPAGNLSGNPPNYVAPSDPNAGATPEGNQPSTGAPIGTNIGPSSPVGGAGAPGGTSINAPHFGWGNSPGLNSNGLGIGDTKRSLQGDPSATGLSTFYVPHGGGRWGGMFGGKGPLLL
jgi:hypothetical protein